MGFDIEGFGTRIFLLVNHPKTHYDKIVKNPVPEHGASSMEKAFCFLGAHRPQGYMAIHPRAGARGILAFSRNCSSFSGISMLTDLGQVAKHLNAPWPGLLLI